MLFYLYIICCAKIKAYFKILISSNFSRKIIQLSLIFRCYCSFEFILLNNILCAQFLVISNVSPIVFSFMHTFYHFCRVKNETHSVIQIFLKVFVKFRAILWFICSKLFSPLDIAYKTLFILLLSS